MGAPCALSPFSLLSSFIKEKSILSTITLVFFRAVASIIASEQGLYDYRHGHVDTIQFNTTISRNPIADKMKILCNYFTCFSEIPLTRLFNYPSKSFVIIRLYLEEGRMVPTGAFHPGTLCRSKELEDIFSPCTSLSQTTRRKPG